MRTLSIGPGPPHLASQHSGGRQGWQSRLAWGPSCRLGRSFGATGPLDQTQTIKLAASCESQMAVIKSLAKCHPMTLMINDCSNNRTDVTARIPCMLNVLCKRGPKRNNQLPSDQTYLDSCPPLSLQRNKASTLCRLSNAHQTSRLGLANFFYFFFFFFNFFRKN